MSPRFILIQLALSALATLAPLAWAQENPPAIDPAVLQKQTGEWIEARRLISAEAAAWETEKASLSDLNAIRKRETGQLEEFVKAAGDRVAELDAQQKKSAAEKASLQQWRKSFEAEVASLEATLKPMTAVFPAPLRDKIGDAIARLETPAEDVPLQNRARDVLLILQAAHEFQNEITLASEVREIDGAKREVDVLYLGMSQAWFVDASGKFGGSGAPGPGAWIWKREPGLAPTIRQAIEVQKRAANPAFVTLPFQNGTLKEEAP